MAARRKRSLNFLPELQPAEPAVDADGLPLDVGVGELLQMYRERNGQELQTVANQLRVRLVYLEAIEDGRFKDLPGTTYAVGFLRSYADYLGLDSADVVRRFREEVARAHGQPRLVFPNIAAEGKIPGSALLLLSVLGAAVVYGAWYYISSRQTVDLPLIAEVPDRLVALPPGEGNEGVSTATPTPLAANESVVPAQEPGAATPPATSSGGDPAVPTDQSAVESAPAAADPGVGSAPTLPTVAESQSRFTDSVGPDGGTASASDPTAIAAAPVAVDYPAARSAETTNSAPADMPAARDPQPPIAATVTSPEFIPPAPPLASLPSAPTEVATALAHLGPRILIEARIDSWIEVLDAEGKTITAQVLRAGESFAPPDQPGMTLTTGNAGGLDLIVDGAKVPSLGEVGAVKRKISLEPEKLKAGQITTQ